VTGRGSASATFPLSAVVGQDTLVLALLLAAVDRRIGGVLLRGQKGSAKTTAARALAALLPDDAPFVELPVGASEDRLVGSIDLRAVLADGTSRFVPGLLHEAHRGVLYVDEVNLLPDHLVDVLLDVAASGINRVEREGVSHLHASQFVLLGSMNPEEGELRPQFLDRFGLAVDVAAPTDPLTRAEAVRRRLAFDADPVEFCARWADSEQDLAERLRRATPAVVPEPLVEQVAVLCARLGVEGLRGDLVCCRAAAALAGWEGRAVAEDDDVRRVAALALAHRRRRSPFEPPGVAPEELAEALDDVLGARRRPPAAPGGATGASTLEETSPETTGTEDEVVGGSPDGESDRGDAPGEAAGEPSRPPIAASAGGPSRPGAAAPAGRRFGSAEPDLSAWQPPLAHPVASRGADGEGRGGRGAGDGHRGRRVGVREPDGPPGVVAVAATVRAAGTRGADRVEVQDLREAVLHGERGRLVVLAVDASGSMGAEIRVRAASAAAQRLLVHAYQRRDRVAVVAFGGDGAAVAMAPTGSAEVARARLAELSTGGRTPLAAGLLLARKVADDGRRRGRSPVIVLISDGRATAAPDGQDPWQAALDAARQIGRAGLATVVVDVEDGPVRLGLARQLAAEMGAAVVEAAELTADVIAGAVEATSPPSRGRPDGRPGGRVGDGVDAVS
jgi:magnesium chelatase subunit D